ncbi:hypothetical protein HPB51_020770 [Rhipicephalus microplus]|uniref:Uncharacterized protein n=1 Tax=Rhipicephalus microplus TaxID=6941 RepID=A0A9J6DPQ7_RHIMP|nr:hypothetical protein HPB51_020770 [Rhipicephalus microplus]
MVIRGLCDIRLSWLKTDGGYTDSLYSDALQTILYNYRIWWLFDAASQCKLACVFQKGGVRCVTDEEKPPPAFPPTLVDLAGRRLDERAEKSWQPAFVDRDFTKEREKKGGRAGIPREGNENNDAKRVENNDTRPHASHTDASAVRAQNAHVRRKPSGGRGGVGASCTRASALPSLPPVPSVEAPFRTSRGRELAGKERTGEGVDFPASRIGL